VLVDMFSDMLFFSYVDCLPIGIHAERVVRETGMMGTTP